MVQELIGGNDIIIQTTAMLANKKNDFSKPFGRAKTKTMNVKTFLEKSLKDLR